MAARGNDKHGHYVLRTLAARIQRVIRPTDVIARYGGEEFVILLPDTDRDAAAEIAERIRFRVEQLPIDPASAGAVPTPVTVSVGLASTGPWASGQVLNDLLQAADRALYAAKNGGRNRVEA